MLIKDLAEQINVHPQVIYIYLFNKKKAKKFVGKQVKNIVLTDEQVEKILGSFVMSNKDHGRLVHRLCGITDNATLSMQDVADSMKQLREKYTIISFAQVLFVFLKEEDHEET